MVFGTADEERMRCHVTMYVKEVNLPAKITKHAFPLIGTIIMYNNTFASVFSTIKELLTKNNCIKQLIIILDIVTVQQIVRMAQMNTRNAYVTKVCKLLTFAFK